VRALALRASEAARETQTVIDEAMASVTDGVEVGAAAVEVLVRIQSQASQASQVVLDIDAATKEQAERLEAIERSANSVADVTSSAAASAEETAAASAEMASQAGTLSELVGRFHLAGPARGRSDRSGRAVSAPPASPRRRATTVPSSDRFDDLFVM
jgi:methyl-accepting chemotaxis protein